MSSTDRDFRQDAGASPRAQGGPSDRRLAALLADLTDPQKQAVLHTDGPLLILAAAGSGKTRVITRRIAHLLHVGVRPWQVLALTFTNKAAGEMRERVERLLAETGQGSEKVARALTITTFHSLCARLLRRYAEHAHLPGLKADYSIYDSSDQSALVKKVIAALNLSTSNWQPRAVLSVISNAKNDLLDADAFGARASDFRGRQIAKIYASYEKALRQANAVDFDDLLLLTARILKERPEIRGECQNRWRYLLIDEYQDTNRAQFQIAAMLAGGGAWNALADRAGVAPNVCVVGDPDQCLVPDTPIMTPLGQRRVDSVRAEEEVLSAAGFGSGTPMRVGKAIARHYRGTLVRVRTASGAELRATPNHIAFARLRVAPDVHYTYLMWKRGVGYRIGTTSGVRASKDGEIVSGLQVRTNQEVADAIWLLKTAATSAEARYWEHLFSIRYGIPTMVFFVRGRRMDMTQEPIDRLHREARSEDGAERLMEELLIDRRYPHHRPGAVTRRGAGAAGAWARRHVLFTMFGDGRSMTRTCWKYHRIQLVTTGDELRSKATPGFPVRGGVRGTWRIETSRKDYDEGMDLAASVAALSDEIEIIPRARLTPGKAFSLMPMSHLHPGMALPVWRDDQVVEDVISSVEREEYAGQVHDLSVPHTRNYVAGGIVVHNSIYGWRGADISNILDFETAFPGCRVIKLGENFRSTAPILKTADTLIKHNRQRRDKPLFTTRPGGEKVRVVHCRDEHHEASLIVDWFRRRHAGADDANGALAGVSDEIARAARGDHPAADGRGARTPGRGGRDADAHDDADASHAGGKQSAPAVPWRSMAVFYRTNALSRVLEDAFRGAGIPYTIARGTAFFDREEIKNALAYLRVVANPADDVSLERIINTPTRGLGSTSVAAMQVWASDQAEPLLEALRSAHSIPGLTKAAQSAAARFIETYDSWTGAGSFLGAQVPTNLADLVQRVIAESGLETHYQKQAEKTQTESDAERLDNLNELINSAAEFEREFAPERDPALSSVTGGTGFQPAPGGTGFQPVPTAQPSSEDVSSSGFSPGVPLNADDQPVPDDPNPFDDLPDLSVPLPPLLSLLRAYLESVALVADADAVDPAQGAVTLMTLHAAKGLEFDTVAIVGLEEGLLPHSRAAESESDLEEERRLAFVGITRAMRSLTLCSARYRTNRGIPERTISSRFLEELDAASVTVSNQADDADDFDDAHDAGATLSPAARSAARRSAAETAVKSQFPPGCLVRHPQFGIGEVMSVEAGATPRATVKFRQAGTKTLVLEYARLTRVG